MSPRACFPGGAFSGGRDFWAGSSTATSPGVPGAFSGIVALGHDLPIWGKITGRHVGCGRISGGAIPGVALLGSRLDSGLLLVLVYLYIGAPTRPDVMPDAIWFLRMLLLVAMHCFWL